MFPARLREDLNDLSTVLMAGVSHCAFDSHVEILSREQLACTRILLCNPISISESNINALKHKSQTPQLCSEQAAG